LRYGLSIVDVAEGAGIHKTQYYEIEATMRGCGPLNAKRLAEFYGLTEKTIRLLATTPAVTQIATGKVLACRVLSTDGDLQPLPDADEVPPVSRG
jgi:hypothetical protein